MDVAVFGTGLLGFPIARRLLQAGHNLSVYNRTVEKASRLTAFGARVGLTPDDAALSARVIIVVLSDYSAVRAVFDQVAEGTWSGRAVVQMGTISPSQSVELLSYVRQRGGQYFECPVLGSQAEAQAGQLILMAGSTPEQFAAWSPFLSCLGPSPRRIGQVGSAAALKLVLNQFIASHVCALSAGLALVQRSGIDTSLFMEILRMSALYAPMFDKKLPRLLARDYARPNFPVEHLLKDMDLFLSAARTAGVRADHLDGVRRIAAQAQAQGLGQEDYAALFEVVNPPGLPGEQS